jgi:hypothetical protein
MLKRLSIVYLLAMLSVCVQAQRSFADSIMAMQDSVSAEFSNEEVSDADDATEEELYDTILKVYPIEISKDTVAYWKDKKEFAYVKNLDSLLEDSQKKEQAKKKDLSDGPNLSLLGKIFNSGILKVLLWVMACIFVVVVLYQLFENKGLFKQRVVKPVEEEIPDAEENILEQDFDSLIQKATREADYRLATRYQFLKTLQRLREKELIEFSVEKTNSRYVREVPVKWRNDFASLILNYEYVWYGKFDLSLQQYELLQQKYVSFNEKI